MKTQKTKQQLIQTPLTLKEWVYAAHGKDIAELVKSSFLEFYFAKPATENNQSA